MTDIGRLVGDISKNETRSENSLYACRDVVGSVQWSATEPFLASCTTGTREKKRANSLFFVFFFFSFLLRCTAIWISFRFLFSFLFCVSHLLFFFFFSFKDIGVFHIFDIRTSFGPEDRRRAPLVFDTGRAVRNTKKKEGRKR